MVFGQRNLALEHRPAYLPGTGMQYLPPACDGTKKEAHIYLHGEHIICREHF